MAEVLPSNGYFLIDGQSTGCQARVKCFPMCFPGLGATDGGFANLPGDRDAAAAAAWPDMRVVNMAFVGHVLSLASSCRSRCASCSFIVGPFGRFSVWVDVLERLCLGVGRIAIQMQAQQCASGISWSMLCARPHVFSGSCIEAVPMIRRPPRSYR
jgi:hypothetical protein